MQLRLRGRTLNRGDPLRLGAKILTLLGFGLALISCNSGLEDLPPCESGTSRSCSTTLGEHGDVLTCYDGVQTCVGGTWSVCSYGEVKSRPSRAYFEGAMDRSPQSLGTSQVCSDNPCDPECKIFTEIPTTPVSSPTDGVMVGSEFEWETGSLSTFPTAFVNKGLTEPCSTGSDCQFNSYCFAPVSGSCLHNKCQTGAALTPSCDPCVEEIVDTIPECGATASTGGGTGPSAACEHSLCEEGDKLENGCSTCVSVICETIPSCCTSAWDAACVAAVTSECGKTCECGTGEVAYAGHCYSHEETDRGWADARTACISRGSGWELAGVTDSSENDFINSFVNDNSETWLGMTEGMGLSTTDTWVWSSGTPSGDYVEPHFGGGGASSVAYDYGSTWRYRTHNNDPGATWNQPSFNDASWSSGAGQLGFGNGDEATAFAKKKVSYYFRRTFTLTSLPAAAELDVIYDDGYVAYLNGQEVARRNVTDASHSAVATATDGDNALDTVSLALDHFQVGTNTMAILVKNISQSSNDISFDSRLVVTSAPPGIAWGDTWKYNVNDPGGSWTSVAYNDASWSSGPAELGFGEGDEDTAITKVGASYYFRKALTLSEAVTSANLSILYDDGYVAYVNGTEVGRRNVTATAHSSNATSTAENTIETISFTPSLLVVGTNTIAVQIKNRNNGSDDVSFDAELLLATSSSGGGGGIFQNFTSGEPNGGGACASYEGGNSGYWLDASCSSNLDSVCEGPPLVEVGADPPPPSGLWSAIELGSNWQYSSGSSAPTGSWQNLGYNDSSWSSGDAHFGFGESDQVTTLTSGRPSYYFRKTISIPNEVREATLQAVFDDGVEIYVNGTRVLTRNIGSTSHSSYATATSSDNESVTASIDTSAFVSGANVISALLKNVSSSSSDVSFDAALTVDLCPSGGCPPPPSWDQSCVDEVKRTCGAICDDDSPPKSIGVCLPHYPGDTDPDCAGVDLSVGIPCNGRIPVCNHGQSDAPAGVRLVYFPADSGDFSTCSPDQGNASMRECFTDEPIPSGRCISVENCTGLTEGREIMVNPPGVGEISECECRDNWSIYSDAACGPPICSGGASVATLSRRPVDIIFIIDNSGSMSGEIAQVQDRINNDFADIIAASGVDYRVIMMSRYGRVGTAVGGSDHPICVSSPLGGHNCSNPTTQAVAHNPPIFYHFSTDVQSTDPLCRLIQGLSNADELAGDARPWTSVAPSGYADLLRPNALKQFVVITDDDVDCSYGGYTFDDNGNSASGTSAAAAFDNALLTLRPDQFGTAADRNYIFHSIVAMSENTPGSAPWPTTSPIQTGQCSPGSDGPGTGYQALSILTGGLRYPTCRNSDFNAVFNALAEEVIEGAALGCSFDLANEGEFDPEDSAVVFTPGAGAPLTFAKVADLASCGPQSYYYEDATTISLCPDTCTAVQNDPSGEISVEVGCLPPSVEYETFEYSESYESVCDPDKGVQWGFLAYDAQTPGNSRIDFFIRAALTQEALELAEWIPLATAAAATSTESCSFVGPSPCPIDLYNALQPFSLDAAPLMELQALIVPTSDGSETPVLNNWSITYSCVWDH